MSLALERVMEESITWEDLPQFMADVRAMARHLLAAEDKAASLHTTALVQTALRRQRLAGQPWTQVTWKNRHYLFGALYKAMDRALKDHGRRRAAAKRAAVTVVRLDDLQLHNLPQIIEERPEQMIA